MPCGVGMNFTIEDSLGNHHSVLKASSMHGQNRLSHAQWLDGILLDAPQNHHSLPQHRLVLSATQRFPLLGSLLYRQWWDFNQLLHTSVFLDIKMDNKIYLKNLLRRFIFVHRIKVKLPQVMFLNTNSITINTIWPSKPSFNILNEQPLIHPMRVFTALSLHASIMPSTDLCYFFML